MSHLTNASSVSFSKKKSFYLPWQEAYEKVDESQAQSLLGQGVELRAQGTDQSVPLPVLSKQDLDEFQSFRNGNAFGSLQEPKLAADLITLKSKGLKFYAKVDDEKQEVGAYGAYNFLTDDLGLSVLSVAFQQVVPKQTKSRTLFRKLASQAKLIDEIVAKTPDDSKTEHWNLLFKTSLQNPEESNPVELSKLAARSITDESWQETGPDMGLVGTLYQDLEGVASQSKLISEIASAKNPEGEKQITLASAISLYEAALSDDKSDVGFYQRAIESAHAEDKNWLSQTLAEKLFPAELKLARELAAPLPKADRPLYKQTYLDSILSHPKVSDKAKLTHLSFEQLKKTGTAPEKLREFLKTGLKLYTPSTKRAQMAQEIAERTNDKGQPLFHSDSQMAILSASLDSTLSDTDFCEKTLGAIEQKDRWPMTTALAKTLFPDTIKDINSWLKFSYPRDFDNHQKLLHQAALQAKEKTPEAMLKLASLYVYNDRKSFEMVNNLYLAVLMSRRNTDEKAKAVLKLLFAKKPDDKYQIQKPASRRVVYMAALKPKMNMRSLLEQSVELVHENDQPFLRETLLEKHFPERLETISRLTQFSSDEELPLHYSLLAQAATKSEDGETPAELVKRAIEVTKELHGEAYGTVTSLYRLSARELAQQNKRTAFLIELAEEKASNGKYQVKKMESDRALYKNALDTKSTDEELFEKILSECEGKDRPFLQRELGSEFFPKLAEKVEELTQFSEPDDEPAHWALLFRASHEANGALEPALLVEKASSYLSNSADDIQLTIKLRLLALKKLSASHPKAKFALQVSRNRQGDWRLNDIRSADALFSNALKEHPAETDFLMNVVEECDESDRSYLTKSLGAFLFDSSGIEVPADITKQLEKGELSATEIKEVYETLKGQSNGKRAETEIGVEDDLIVIGDEELEVDL